MNYNSKTGRPPRQWILSVDILENAGACQTSQDQFENLFGRKTVKWNKRNYDKAMRGYVEAGELNGFGNYNYMNPTSLFYKMQDAHDYQLDEDDALRDLMRDAEVGEEKARRKLANEVFNRLENFRVNG